MFVEYVTQVDLSLPEVEKRLTRMTTDVDDSNDVAFRSEGRLRARIWPRPGISREVSLDVWPPEVSRSGIVYPLRWRVDGSTTLLPSLNADLALTKVGAGRTTITLRGTYEPPLGAVGRVVDRALLGRFADAAVADWMERLIARLNSKV